MLQTIKTKLENIGTHPYFRFVSRKFMFYLVVSFVSLTIAWGIPRFMPGSPIVGYMQAPPMGLTSSARRSYMRMRNFIEQEFGLDQPIFQQFVEFWGNLLTLNLGTSYINRTPVFDYIVPYATFTLSLVVPVLFISFFLGNWMGARSAYITGKKNAIVYYTLIVIQSAPFYWFALLFYVFFVADLGIFPAHVPSAVPPEHIPGKDPIKDFLIFTQFYVAPFLVLLISQIGGWATGMRAMTLYEKDSEYLLYAQQLGFKQKIIRQYAQRNAILPQITGLNMNLNNLIGQTLIIEAVFGWPGLGMMNIDALSSQDFPVIVGGFIITLIVVVFGNFLLDITYGFFDPRIRSGSERKSQTQ